MELDARYFEIRLLTILVLDGIAIRGPSNLHFGGGVP
jgi:hypothetical protein